MTYSQIKIVHFFSLHHFDISFLLLLHNSSSPNHPLHHTVTFPYTIYYIDRHNLRPFFRSLLNQLSFFMKPNIRDDKDPCPKPGGWWGFDYYFSNVLLKDRHKRPEQLGRREAASTIRTNTGNAIVEKTWTSSRADGWQENGLAQARRHWWFDSCCGQGSETLQRKNIVPRERLAPPRPRRPHVFGQAFRLKGI